MFRISHSTLDARALAVEIDALFMVKRDLLLAVSIAAMVNMIGHSAIGYHHDLDWYRAAVERHMAAAGLS